MENFTEKLPLQIRVAMARQWMTGVALEVSLRVNNSPEELPEALRKPLNLITEDMADCALAALITLETDMKNHLLWEVSHQCLLDADRLYAAMFEEDEEDLNGAGE